MRELPVEAEAAGSEPIAPEGGGGDPGEERRLGAGSGSASRRALDDPPLRLPRVNPVVLVGGVGLALVAVVLVGGLRYLASVDRAQEKRAFLANADRQPAKEVLWAASHLSPAVRGDPEVKALVARLSARERAEAARSRAEELLAGVTPSLPPRRASARCRAALSADPTFVPAALALAGLDLSMAHHAGGAGGQSLRALARSALLDLDRAIQRAPQDPRPYLARARVFHRIGDDPAALNDLDRTEVLDRRRPSGGGLALAADGERALLEGHAQDAARAFGRALTLTPHLPAALLGRARARLWLGETRGALVDALSAREVAPRCAEAYVLSARARWLGAGEGGGGLDPREAAQADVARALDLDPLDPEALALRATLRAVRGPGGDLVPARGARAAALADARRALALDPAQPLAYATLAELALGRGDATGALRLAREGRRRGARGDPRDLLRLSLLEARARVASGALGQDGAGVLADIDAALRSDPRNAPSYLLRAQVLLRLARRREARSDLDRALALDPGLTRAYLLRGRMALEASPPDLPRAIADLGAYLRRRPKDGPAHLLRARAYHQASLFRKALADLAVASRLGGDLPRADLLGLRGDCAYRLRDWKGALAAYRAYLHLIGPDAAAGGVARARARECEERLKGEGREY